MFVETLKVDNKYKLRLYIMQRIYNIRDVTNYLKSY